jgi:hypothetical protein
MKRREFLAAAAALAAGAPPLRAQKADPAGRAKETTLDL